MREKVLTFLENWAQKPVVAFSSFAAFITTVWALFELVTSLTRSWSTLALGALVFIIIAPGLISFLFFSFHRLYRLPYADRYINIETHQQWLIKHDGSREIKGSSTIVFYRPPRKADCFDIVYGSLDLGLHKLPYSSPDARVVDAEQINPQMCKLYWEPKEGEIEIGIPYSHTFSTTYPKGDSPTEKSITVATRAYSKTVRVSVLTERPIKWIIAFRRPLLVGYRSFERIERAARRVRKTNAPAVEMLASKHCEWRTRDVERGTVYYVVIYLDQSSAEALESDTNEKL